jgi:hypothetical protein
MNEDYENVKSYLLRSIYSISIFNCKKLDITDKELLSLVNNLVKYITDKWEDDVECIIHTTINITDNLLDNQDTHNQ